MPRELYSEAEQSLKSSGKYMVSASIKAAKFTVKEFEKICQWIEQCLSGKNKDKIGKQSLKDLISHGNKVVEIGVDAPNPEEMLNGNTQSNSLSWDKKMIKGFEKYADKYGINYTILEEKKKGKGSEFHVFFEGKDASVVNQCLQNYLKDRIKQRGKGAISDKIKSNQERVVDRKPEQEVMRTDKLKDKVPQHGER